MAEFPEDREQLKKDYFDSEFMNWGAFCEAKGYPTDYRSYPRSWYWQKKKKEQHVWKEVAQEMTERLTRIEPDYSKQILMALDSVPKGFMGLWVLVNNAIKFHVENKTVDPQSIAMLASAAKTASEGLQKSLGMEGARRAIRELKNQVDVIEMGEDDAEKERTEIHVKRLTASGIEMDLKEAIEKYVDKPRTNTESDV